MKNHKSGKMKSKLPKWFKGEHYPNGDVVKNPFSGEKYKLNAEELSMYDFIMGAQVVIGDNWMEDKYYNLQNDMRKGIDWFRKNNAKAYMKLLD